MHHRCVFCAQRWGFHALDRLEFLSHTHPEPPFRYHVEHHFSPAHSSRMPVPRLTATRPFSTYSPLISRRRFPCLDAFCTWARLCFCLCFVRSPCLSQPNKSLTPISSPQIGNGRSRNSSKFPERSAWVPTSAALATKSWARASGGVF